MGLEGSIALGAGREEDHAVHLASDHQLKQLTLLIQIPGGVAEDDIVASCPGLTVNVIGQLGHEGVVYAGEDQPQELGAVHDHGTGNGVGGVVHFLADLQDPLPGIHTDFRTAGECTGHRGIGDASRLCYIFDGHILHKRFLLRKLYRKFP